jgi:hypothetical protein
VRRLFSGFVIFQGFAARKISPPVSASRRPRAARGDFRRRAFGHRGFPARGVFLAAQDVNISRFRDISRVCRQKFPLRFPAARCRLPRETTFRDAPSVEPKEARPRSPCRVDGSASVPAPSPSHSLSTRHSAPLGTRRKETARPSTGMVGAGRAQPEFSRRGHRMRLPSDCNENQDNTYSVLSEENSTILKNSSCRRT